VLEPLDLALAVRPGDLKVLGSERKQDSPPALNKGPGSFACPGSGLGRSGATVRSSPEQRCPAQGNAAKNAEHERVTHGMLARTGGKLHPPAVFATPDAVRAPSKYSAGVPKEEPTTEPSWPPCFLR
jgi:hypothetical protein